MDSSLAAQKRSIRTIKSELEFLADSSLLTAQQLSAITALLPEPKATALNTNAALSQPTPSPAPSPAPISRFRQAQNVLSEKQQQTPQPAASYQQPPLPAYNAAPAHIATASALYTYRPTDSGDLALQPNDTIKVLENMNADWARGRNERTGQEGIFPRSYVSVVEDKGGAAPGLPARAQPQADGSGYGNMPVEVANGNGSAAVAAQGGDGNKVNEQGKKFGKKLGNAAIFGAGATIGSNIVNSIF